ncbi:MAG: UDP-N-acetylmuramoyl-L-alanine--D-glutamate ligase, partial [Pseudomonadota bacterium]
NADATARALAAYENVRWIAGGRAKEGGIAALSGFGDRVAAAYFYGECAGLFAGQMAEAMPGVPHATLATLDQAVAAARADAAPGDVLLLSPAAASFDQFASFEARGDAFRALIETAQAPQGTEARA